MHNKIQIVLEVDTDIEKVVPLIFSECPICKRQKE